MSFLVMLEPTLFLQDLVMISSMVEMIKTKFLVVLAMIKSLVALELTHLSEIS